MKEKSVLKNALLNIIRVSLSVIFPLITFPYVSRVLMAERLGRVNYALSIENYFALIAALGISTYAVREGARRRHDKKEFDTFANEVFTVNFITTILSYILLTITVISVKNLHSYVLLIYLQSASIVLSTIGVDWINSVFEDYLYITIRSFAIQVVLLIVMFITVKTPEDYYKYAFLTVLSNGISCTLNFFYTRRYCKVRLIKNCHFFEHIKSLLIFFANNLAMSVYLNADTTMLGFMDGDYVVGIYAVAVKIYNVIKAVIAAMFTACIPRLASYFGSEKYKEYKLLLNQIINVCTLIMLPAVAGLIVLARPIVLLLSGKSFEQATSSLSIIALGIIGAIYGGIMTNCINLPMKRETYNLKGTIIAAIVNVLLNFIFIPLFHENGAALTTVIAEFTVFGYCLFTFKNIKEYVDFKPIIRNIFTGLGECAIVFLLDYVLVQYISDWIAHMVLLVGLSISSYVAVLIITKNPILKTVSLR